ncbi:MAG: class I SAM-dependent rRNA methyltransferase [Gammaproteobacteria bacterium]|nr:class I SAM-dependent rRNA methyltransferase [Gammaproteobacteria bacterium]MCP5138118.1 class I SAM-dependent rRNA methyltransferase [Gammaproteobacteria bacterium]
MSTDYEFKTLRLKARNERRLMAGHQWVYSNEIDVAVSPLAGFEAGDSVTIEAANGKAIGTGYINPHTLLSARLVSRDAKHPFSASLLVHRINVALALREKLFDKPYYRLVFGEADGLPGLVVDRYDNVLVAQITTAGMERIRDDIAAALDKVIKPLALLWRNDTGSRELEGLPSYVEAALGVVPATVAVIEGDARFHIDPIQGQKTGWFYDQRDNRERLGRYAKGARVLDLFSYAGAWGIRAVQSGASEAVCVDASAGAIEQVEANAELNGLTGRVAGLRGDVFEVLKNLRAERERFDIVITDPPAFIKRRKDFKEGRLAYRRLNQMAMQVMSKDGILVACSCSHHLPREELQTVVFESARHVDRDLQVLEHGYQAPDHPVHPGIPETSYLKTITSRVVSR